MIWLLLGLALVALALLDALWTTVAPRGAGPVSGPLARGVWRLGKALGGGRPPGWSGPAVLVAALVWWVLAHWAGWTLVFAADPGAIVDSQTGAPAEGWDRAYVVGTYLATLGLGAAFEPGTGFWGAVAVVVAINGFAVLTLGVTYVLQVVSAVTESRRIAGVVHALGETPADVLRRAWTGDGFDGLGQHLTDLAPLVEAHGRRHEAYPALHFFHSGSRRTAGPAMVPVLSETLLLLRAGVAPGARLAPAETEPLWRTIGGYLDTLSESFADDASEAPPPPDLAALAEAGVPTVGAEAWHRAVAEAAPRRRLLRGLARDDGWTWDGDVAGARLGDG